MKKARGSINVNRPPIGVRPTDPTGAHRGGPRASHNNIKERGRDVRAWPASVGPEDRAKNQGAAWAISLPFILAAFVRCNRPL